MINVGYEGLHNFVKYMREIQTKDDNDIIIGNTGRKGSGKSTLSILCARLYHQKYFNEKSINLKEYIAYNNEDVFETIHRLENYRVYVGDEAVRFAWSREWNKTANKDLIKMATQIRTKKLIFFMNIPKISWIDSAYREGMLDIWLWVHASFSEGQKKCYAFIFEPDEHQAQSDSWHLADFKKIYRKKKSWRIGRFTDIEKLYKHVRNHPCFVDYFQFPALPEDLYSRYLQIRDSRVFEHQKAWVEPKEAAKILCYNILHNLPEFLEVIKNEGREGKPSTRAIEKVLMRNPQTNKPLLTYQTVALWDREIRKRVPEKHAPELIKQELEAQKDAHDSFEEEG